MKTTKSQSMFLVLAALTGLTACSSGEQLTADTVVRDANILTMASAAPTATALAVKNGRIVFVGDDEAVTKWIGDRTEVVDADGATVLPGFIDTHTHPVIGAYQLEDCSLDDKVTTLTMMQPLVETCLQRLPAGDKSAWLAIINLNPAGFTASAGDLDKLVPDRPFALFGTDGHTAWVNSRGLMAAGIDRATADPAGGKIVRDESGAATGRLIDTAVELAFNKLPKKSLAEQLRLTELALQQMHAVGLTTVLEASANRELLTVYKALAEQGKLTAKVSVALTSDADPSVEHLAELEALRQEYRGVTNLQVDTVKVFADGVLEHPTQSAALLAPYLHADGKPAETAGELYFVPEKMADFVSALDSLGFNVHVHAIGDAAVRASLDAFAAARQRNGEKSTAKFSISHLELIHPDDWPRFKALQVYASFQLLWGQPDVYSVDAVQPYLGAERSRWLYPAGAIHRAGGSVVAGSDWNVSSFNPWEAMAVGVCRCNADEPERPALLPEQALPLDVMLRAYTIEAARMLGRDHDIGSLERGKAADLVLLASAPTADASALRQMQVDATMVDGIWRYRRQPD